MNIKFDHEAAVTLAPEQFVKLHDCQGMKVECRMGSLWITQDNDSTDYVLGPGQVLELEHGGDAIVFALMQSEMMLHEPLPVASPLDQFGAMILAGLDGLGEWIAAHFGPEAISARKLRGWYGAL